jgi:hypothetical protein
MKPIVKWQYDQIVKELLLLQEHEEDKTCPCQSAGEMCVHKHLMTLEAYAEETSAMETDVACQEKLKTLALEAQEHRRKEEEALCGQGEHEDLIQWARDSRKQFETYALACDVEVANQTCDLV